MNNTCITTAILSLTCAPTHPPVHSPLDTFMLIGHESLLLPIHIHTHTHTHSHRVLPHFLLFLTLSLPLFPPIVFLPLTLTSTQLKIDIQTHTSKLIPLLISSHKTKNVYILEKCLELTLSNYYAVYKLTLI